MQWTLDYLPDLESDFSAIHRIDDMYSLPSYQFFNFAYRMAAYQGVMRFHAEQASEKSQMASGVTRGDDTMREVPADSSSLQLGFGEFMEVAEV